MFENRRKSRELALQALFQGEFVQDSPLLDRLNYFKESFAIEDEVLEYAQQILQKMDAHGDQINGIIREKSTNWSLERMSKVDLCILRLALSEIIGQLDVPHKVVINEAIELAKKYGNTESAAFINGILDEHLKDIQ